MSFFVCASAILQCSFGSAPSNLSVLPTNCCRGGMFFANIMDNKPMINILPFNTCSSPANPAVIANFGKPVPCIPVTLGQWITGSPTVLLGNLPALNDKSSLICCWAGVIKIKHPGQNTVSIP